MIGGGLAGMSGMSAAIHLAKAGLKVICLEADVENSDPVGESLDWSAPELLKSLGFPMDRLLHEGIATWKRHVILKPGTRRGRISSIFPATFSGSRRRCVCLNLTHDLQHPQAHRLFAAPMEMCRSNWADGNRSCAVAMCWHRAPKSM